MNDIFTEPAFHSPSDHEADLRRINQFRPIDDTFMRVLMRKNCEQMKIFQSFRRPISFSSRKTISLAKEKRCIGFAGRTGKVDSHFTIASTFTMQMPPIRAAMRSAD